MRQTLTKNSGLPKLEVAKKLDLTITGVSSVISEQPKPAAPRYSQPSSALAMAMPRPSLNLKPKQVSFQCLGEVLGDEVLDSSSGMKSNSWSHQETLFD